MRKGGSVIKEVNMKKRNALSHLNLMVDLSPRALSWL